MNPNCFYSSGADGLIVEWQKDIKDGGKLIATIGKPVYSMLLDEESLQLLCGTSRGNLHIIDLKENKEIKNIEVHNLGIFDMRFTDKHLITCGGDGVVAILDKEDFSLIKKINHSEKSARIIAVHPSHKEFSVGYSDFEIRTFECSNFDLIRTLSGHTNSVFALAYSPDGNFLLSSGRDAMIKVWDIKKQHNLIMDIPAHTLQIKCIAFNLEGNLFASSSMDKTIKIWDAYTFELLKVIDFARNESHTNCINKILWLNNNEFVSCSDDKKVMSWNISL